MTSIINTLKKANSKGSLTRAHLQYQKDLTHRAAENYWAWHLLCGYWRHDAHQGGQSKLNNRPVTGHQKRKSK